MVVGLGVVLGACTGDESPSGTATPEVSGTAEVSATAEPSPTASPSPTPELEPIRDEIAVRGLFEDPRLGPTPDRRVTVGASPFGAHDGVSTTLYDFESRVAHDLGPGTAGAFSPDGETFAWLSVSDARSETRTFHAQLNFLRVGTGEVTTFDRVYERCWAGLRRSSDVYFQDDDIVHVSACREWASAHDGEQANPEAVAEALTSRTPEQPFYIVSLPVEREPRDALGRLRWLVNGLDPEGRASVAIDALFAERISEDEMRVGVPTGGFGEPWNFFIVDVTTREATFIATVPWSGRADADAEYAAWSTNACGYASGSPAVTYVLDRSSGEVVEIDEGMWPLIDHGQVADRGSGFRLLVDLDTLETRTLPQAAFGRT